jgi:PleD family two-component response regulator
LLIKEAKVQEKAKILIIDDEEDICHFSRSILEKTGRFEVFVSTRPQAGISLAKANKPDLILLDIFMPEMEPVRSPATPSSLSR